MSRSRGTGTLYRKPGRTVWMMQFYVDGRRVRESTGKETKSEAEKVLRAKLGQVDRHELIVPTGQLARIRDLHEFDVSHYSVTKKLPGDHARRWSRLEPHFANIIANRHATIDVLKYCQQRQEEGAANATINRELSVLRHLMRVGRTTTPPQHMNAIRIELLAEDNARSGFVEDDGFQKLKNACQLPEDLWLRTWIEMAYTYPCRKNELLALRVEQVDMNANTITLEAKQTKTKKARVWAMTQNVRQLIAAMIVGKRSDERVLTRDGKPIIDMRKAWRRIATAAGLPELIAHDFRRSAAKRLIRAGVDESTIMKMAGWKTRSMFDRYHIDSASDQKRAIKLLEQHEQNSHPTATPEQFRAESSAGDAKQTIN